MIFFFFIFDHNLNTDHQIKILQIVCIVSCGHKCQTHISNKTLSISFTEFLLQPAAMQITKYRLLFYENIATCRLKRKTRSRPTNIRFVFKNTKNSINPSIPHRIIHIVRLLSHRTSLSVLQYSTQMTNTRIYIQNEE